MTSVQFDGSFAGFLSAVMDVYRKRIPEVEFTTSAGNLFSESFHAVCSTDQANRVWAGIQKRFSAQAGKQLYAAHLSELPGIHNLLWRYLKYGFDRRENIETDFSHEAVLKVSQIAKQVSRERHRMTAFIRFQKTQDGLFYALVEPDFDVLPLISDHFAKRYADQNWMIYDLRRKYGLYFDQSTVQTVDLQFDEPVEGSGFVRVAKDDSEELYQRLWKEYFQSVNIASRKNMALHIRHMPKRYWRHLTEKLPVQPNNLV